MVLICEKCNFKGSFEAKEEHICHAKFVIEEIRTCKHMKKRQIRYEEKIRELENAIINKTSFL